MAVGDRSAHHLDALLGSLDDEDYDNIADTDDVESIAESLRRSTKKRKLDQLPDKYGIISQRGTELMFAEQYEKALDVFEDVANAVKNFAPIFIWMADCCQALGQTQRAFECCKKATQIDRMNAEAWSKYADLADTLEMEGDLLIGLKATIVLNLKQPHTVLPQLQRFVKLLEASKVPSVARYQRLLFQAELDAGLKPECYYVATSIARGLLDVDRVQPAFQFLEAPITAAIDAGETLPEPAVLAFTETLLRMGNFPSALNVLLLCNIVKLLGPDGEECQVISDAVSVVLNDTPAEPFSLPLVAAVCLVLVHFDNFPPTRDLFLCRIMAAPAFEDNKLFLDLAVLLRQQNYLEEARQLLERLEQQPQFKKPEFYLQLGTALEGLKDFKGALDAFNRALSLKPSLRQARYRIRRLGLPVPKFGTPEGRAQTTLLQKKTFDEYLEAKTNGDREAVMDLASDLVSSSFDPMSVEDMKEIIFHTASPYRVDIATKEYVQLAPAIAAADGVPLEDFWSALVEGCQIAFEDEKFEELFIMAFHGLCIADFIPSPEKTGYLRQALLDSTYRLGHSEFCLRYLRDGLLVANKAQYSTAVWNFFYLLIAERKQRDSHAVYKWASRLAHYDPASPYTRQLQMIMANDSCSRDLSYRRSFEVYNAMVVRDGIDGTPWYVLLQLAIMYIQLACRHHCSQRVPLYSAAMQLLDKYAVRRGICPEVYFNKGRAAQQFGDLAEAIGFYEECIRISAQTTILTTPGTAGVFDCSVKAALNLRAIYIAFEQPEKVEALSRGSVLDWKKFRKSHLH